MQRHGGDRIGIASTVRGEGEIEPKTPVSVGSWCSFPLRQKVDKQTREERSIALLTR